MICYTFIHTVLIQSFMPEQDFNFIAIKLKTLFESQTTKFCLHNLDIHLMSSQCFSSFSMNNIPIENKKKQIEKMIDIEIDLNGK